MKTMTLSAVLNPEADGYVSLCPELDIASQGDTIDEALANLKEALEGFFETASAEEVRMRLQEAGLVHPHRGGVCLNWGCSPAPKSSELWKPAVSFARGKRAAT